MKKIITSNVLDPLQLQPFTAQSLRFLQESKEDDVAALIKALVISNLGSYSLTTPYVISGCVVSDAGKDVTAGEIFYGGKYYQTTAVNGTTNIARFILTPSQDATADPLTFSNGTPFNVHTIYKYVPTDVATGGDFTSSNLVSLYPGVVSKLTLDAGTILNVAFSSGLNNLIPGATLTTPNDGITRKWLIIYEGIVIPYSANTDAYMVIRLFNGATSIREMIGGKVFSAIGGTIYCPITLHKIYTLGPNSTIDVKATPQGNLCDLESQQFYMIEL